MRYALIDTNRINADGTMLAETFIDPRTGKVYFDFELEQIDELGFIGALISAGTTLLGGLFGGGNSAQFQGLSGINSGGQQLIQALNQIRSGLASGQISPDQAVSEAQRLAATLNDPAIFYPAKKGKDAQALQNFKTQAAQIVQQIQSDAAALKQAQLNALQQSANTGGGGNSSVVSFGGLSVDSSTLMLVGGGLLAITLLKR